VGEVQSPLNQKLGLKILRAVDFALRFVLLIKSKFTIRIFNNYYESRYKINGFQSLWIHFLVQRVLNLPHLHLYNGLQLALVYCFNKLFSESNLIVIYATWGLLDPKNVILELTWQDWEGSWWVHILIQLYIILFYLFGTIFWN
jgi:hypothetical protein